MASLQRPWQPCPTLNATDVAQLQSLHAALLKLRKEVIAGWLDALSPRAAEVQSLCRGAQLLAQRQVRSATGSAILLESLGGFVQESEYLRALCLAASTRSVGEPLRLHFASTQRSLFFYLRHTDRDGKLQARTVFERSHPVAFAVCLAATGADVTYDL